MFGLIFFFIEIMISIVSFVLEFFLKIVCQLLFLVFYFPMKWLGMYAAGGDLDAFGEDIDFPLSEDINDHHQ